MASNQTVTSEEKRLGEANSHVHPTFQKILNGFAPHVPATRKTFAVYDRDFDPLYAAQDEHLRVQAFDKADALKQGAAALRCNVSDLKAFEVQS